MAVITRLAKVSLCICVTLAYIDWGLLLSLQPAFYPTEAEKRGATPSQYGFVFGIASFAAFICSLLSGHYGPRIGPTVLLISGSFIQGFTCACFGFLAYVNDTNWFIILSYLLRFLEGSANAVADASILGILMQVFPGKESSITAWTEMSLGLGYMLGPFIGFSLYSVGGFGLPFFLSGSLGTALAVTFYVLIPKIDKGQGTRENFEEIHDEEVQSYKRKPSMTIQHYIKHPSLMLPFLDNFICFAGNGMIEAMLEPHLKNEAGAAQLDVAFTYLIMGGCYVLTTPIVGYVADHLVSQPLELSIAGNILNAFCFVFLGPLPVIGLQPSVAMIDVSVAFVGFGYALIVVSTFSRAHKLVMAKGFEPNIGTSLLISGLWTASFHLGNFVGPSASGFMVEALGFSLMALVDTYELCLYMGCDRRLHQKEYKLVVESD